VPALAVLTGVCVAVLATSWLLATRGVADWEVDVGRWAHDLPDWTTPVLEVVMQAGARPAPVVVAAVLAVTAGWRWRAAGVAVAGLLAWPVSWWLKEVVGRDRPTQAELGRPVREVLGNHGFPSSHAAISAAVAVAVVLLGRPRPGIRVAVLAVAVLTALARLHLGVHWALDVIGGAALGTLLAVGVAYLVGMPPTGAVARTGGDDELVVATFNIRNGRAWDGWDSWPLRARAAAADARDLGADVLAIQEAFAFQSRFLAAALPGYERVGRGRGRRGGEWCPVYVRADRLRVVAASTRWYGEQPDQPGSRLSDASFPRIATEVRLAEVGSGAELVVVNTHLDERHPANRRRSAEQLVDRLAPDVATVVLGDLNATPEAEPELFAVFARAGLADALPDATAGTAHDFRGGTDHRRIDHILVSDHWEVVDAAVVADERTRRLPSDHWPVRARLRRR
jgi:endonuclease/exonuclease/phosphatase family metal-dependent hydrolase/membrane-associated phospholipid phosphatase